MANLKISSLNNLLNSQVATNDVLPIVDVSAPETKKISVAELDKRYKDPSDTLAAQVTVNTIDIDALKQGTNTVVVNPGGTTTETTTSDGTTATLGSAAIALNTASLITAKVTARRTSGAGSNADSCCFILRTKAKNVGGIVEVSNTVAEQWKDVDSWNAELSVVGSSVAVRITGAAGTNISWKSTIEIQTV